MRDKNKRIESIFWKRVAGILAAGLVIFSLIQLFYSSSTENRKNSSDVFPSGNNGRVVVKGLRISESVGGHPFFTAEIDRVRYEHKKIGFLRFGMLPVAVVENLRLTVFDTKEKNNLTTGRVNKSQPIDKLPIWDEIEKYVSNPEFLRLFKLDRAHNIRFEPLHFKIVRNNKAVLTVDCQKLVPDMRNNVLKLSGNVLIATESKRVEGDSVSFNWKKNRFLSDKACKLILDKHTVMRIKLDTDIFLSSLSRIIRESPHAPVGR